ncbi:DsbA family protein [Pseudomonas sp. SWI6]|uniref:DsbA family protein n=1 Tax=Pseudomonas taiwanensis TaxID=470150 RepID=A0ABR6V776_9PSED|nr:MULTISPECIES: DsbA family protein [Pseudomonas]AGZ34099.1 DSBA oxidoreductase [Pseudomonas sp. VLB120]AVD84339.1 DsbA family protein [Pseudomonas sp. SWI6]AVD86552.1 DsbA family protein [Pseudomonas sp. SWI44]MBC3476286.1 DsbA family protein [Pseudomonas taiwanensis]MBC3492164.1 DsbA family protein [Pseudomonas taiwanensis]
MSARLLYVMDPMCSWCWGFAPVAEALIAQAREAGVPTRVVPGGLRTGGSALDASTRKYILEHWQAVADATGQPFRFDGAMPDGFVYDTEPACRALVTARELDAERVWPLLALIQRSFYEQGVDVTRAPQLVELAEQVGFDRERFAQHFASHDVRAATAADFSWVQDLGIAGFPTLLAERNGQLALLTNGYQPLDRLQPLLGRWLGQAACA